MWFWSCWWFWWLWKGWQQKSIAEEFALRITALVFVDVTRDVFGAVLGHLRPIAKRR
ncbi:hypothetical protein MPSYJ_41650 [Mycolicibacterium psychrotolerans]|uniref:Uncharacterized protein n=1 Tax=Mycolicibacterium psychrotolerans TaxID=216929 RepID=A0A7I7MEG6_9MYCO|nr:hypothetical protein MPSYJ_41650 [Mycolicibacterium psychrotolerans]